MSSTSPDKPLVSVVGAGAWGTTLAWLLAAQGHPVRLWCLEPDLAEEMRATRRNSRFRPEIELPPHVEVTTDLAAAWQGPQVVVLAVPSRFLRDLLRQSRPLLTSRPLLLSATKGLEETSGLRMSQVVRQELPEDCPLAVLSGPNLSREIALGMPTVSVVAASDPALAARGQELLQSSLFRTYRNCDIIGVEMCGALKNVIAIGAGVCEGLGFGANSKAALITRGLTEMARLGVALGAQPGTFWGAAGLGDLVATCHSHDSRNWTVGWRLASGASWTEISAAMLSVAEGVYTASAARRLGEAHGVPLPVTEAICGVLFEGLAVPEAVRRLMTRPGRAEDEDWYPGAPAPAGDPCSGAES